MRDFTLITNNSELGSGKKGASLGVQALINEIKNYDFEKLIECTKIIFDFNLSNQNKDINNKIAKHIKEISENYTVIYDRLCNELIQENFNLFISGDHSSTASYLCAIKSLNPEKNIGLIWVDAHADLHSPYTTPSGNMHGMTVAISTGLDNIENKVNNPDKVTLEYWEILKSYSLNLPTIDFCNIIYVGLRDIEKEESEAIKNHNIKVFSCEDVNTNPNHISQSILSYFKNVDYLFISFDVDSLDPNEVSWATGTPVKNGLKLNSIIELLVKLAQDSRLIGFEIVEINPLLEKENQSMPKAAMELVKAIVENVV